jgi:hypothetical protein
MVFKVRYSTTLSTAKFRLHGVGDKRMNVGCRWNDTDRRNLKCTEKTLSHCHLVHHKLHTEYTFKNVLFNEFARVSVYTGTADGGTVFKVLRYKSEGRWFDSRWCHWNFPLT